uniref:Uncharacterized protein n=1 Tax=Candidatus Kentrum sp. DK TaxID=2126562 RepID=A0A450SGD3_9GAMM|nr:MAG: hypothetical protein BECKDK2373B_GA0170837_103534 [Candidatus Kentron sp. DK]
MQYYLKILWHYICAPPSVHIINQDLMKLWERFLVEFGRFLGWAC